MRISPLLRRLFRSAAPARAQTRDALEDELMRGFADTDRPRTRRWWSAVVVGGGALVGACVAPAKYDLDVGHRLLITATGDNPDVDPEALAGHIREGFEVDELRVLVQKSRQVDDHGETEVMRVALDIGGTADIDAIEDSLIDAFPALSDADIDAEVLDGTVRGTVGGMLSHRTLGIVLDDRGVEETRAQILADLVTRGLDGHATVEIEEEDTPQGRRREVRIKVEAEDPRPN